MGGIFIPFHSVNDEAAHGPCVSSLVPITVDGIGFLGRRYRLVLNGVPGIVLCGASHNCSPYGLDPKGLDSVRPGTEPLSTSTKAAPPRGGPRGITARPNKLREWQNKEGCE